MPLICKGSPGKSSKKKFWGRGRSVYKTLFTPSPRAVNALKGAVILTAAAGIKPLNSYSLDITTIKKKAGVKPAFLSKHSTAHEVGFNCARVRVRTHAINHLLRCLIFSKNRLCNSLIIKAPKKGGLQKRQIRLQKRQINSAVKPAPFAALFYRLCPLFGSE